MENPFCQYCLKRLPRVKEVETQHQSVFFGENKSELWSITGQQHREYRLQHRNPVSVWLEQKWKNIICCVPFYVKRWARCRLTYIILFPPILTTFLMRQLEQAHVLEKDSKMQQVLEPSLAPPSLLTQK